MENSNCSAPLFFIINQAHANGPQTLKSLVNQGIKIFPLPRIQQKDCGLSCFLFAQRSDVGNEFVIDLLRKGSLVISDGAAQKVASLAIPDCFPDRFLEIGAGRGTKSLLLQNVALSRFGKQMALDTLDVDQSRTKERISRLKQADIVQNEVFCQDATHLSHFSDATYDAVFIDAPCTGVGTLRRHADIRWRVTEHEISAMAEKGLTMLKQAARLVKPGGSLTYATCTLFKEENEQVIEAFLKSEQGNSFSVSSQLLFDDLFHKAQSEPLFDTHFVCKLQKDVS
jgi:16S rRNA (cytosine967-C5)-methyltransferase